MALALQVCAQTMQHLLIYGDGIAVQRYPT
jgi:hypothetical protein